MRIFLAQHLYPLVLIDNIDIVDEFEAELRTKAGLRVSNIRPKRDIRLLIQSISDSAF